MKTAHWLTTLILAVTILFVTQGSAHAQSGDVQYFPQTGHNVRGVFLQLYKAAKDPTLVYGYPITEQIKSKDGKTVQYFQRARFELTNVKPFSLQRWDVLPIQPKTPAVYQQRQWMRDLPNRLQRLLYIP